MKKLAILASALAMLATPVLAQSSRISGAVPLPTPRPAVAAKQLTPSAVQQNPFAMLQQFSAADLTAALADANAQTPPDQTSAQCYTALLALVNSPVNSPLPAGPGAFQLLQKARDMKQFLATLQSPNGPLSQLNLACAPLVMDVNSTLLALGVSTGIVAATGGTALPATPRSRRFVKSAADQITMQATAWVALGALGFTMMVTISSGGAIKMTWWLGAKFGDMKKTVYLKCSVATKSRTKCGISRMSPASLPIETTLGDYSEKRPRQAGVNDAARLPDDQSGGSRRGIY